MALTAAPTLSTYNTGSKTSLEMLGYYTLADGTVLRLENNQAGTWGYQGISTATTTVVKSGAGQLHQIIVLGGTLGAITVYDNTAASGTVIAPTFTPPTLAGGPAVYTFDVSFATGLTIVTAAATVLTVTAR